MSNITTILQQQSHHPLANDSTKSRSEMTLSALEAMGATTVQTTTAWGYGYTYTAQNLDGVPTLLQLPEQYNCIEQQYWFRGIFDQWLMGFHFFPLQLFTFIK